MVGYSHPVRVTAEVAKYMLRAAEWTFRVDHPVVAEQLAEPGGEGLGLGEESQISMKAKLAIGKRISESGHELATKNPAQHFDWKEEGVTEFYPARVIGRQPAGRTTQWTCG